MSIHLAEWSPETTRVFVVGLLEWEDPEIWAPFPDAVPGRFDAKLVQFFKSQGVPESQIVYLQDSEATLEAIQESLVEFLEDSDEEELLILYFAGHGDWDSETNEYYFANYDAAEDYEGYWSVSSIIDDIEENFSGSHVLLMADCCYSGGLIDALKERDLSFAYACVTSAYSHNSSTGEWTFTEALMKGLQGDPVVDLDGDGWITLYDFARYAELEMAFIEEQKSMFLTLNDFDPQMQLAKVTKRGTPGGEKRVEVEYDGTWYKAKILEQKGNQARVFYIVDRSEEWVDSDRIRPYEPETFSKGKAVQVEFEEEWYPATVKRGWYGLHFVGYDGYDETWDEWVGSDRIQPA
ncbi:caspase family protein [Desertifilum sp. FACHB-1129]|uniref:Tudor domain-containing protein n=1 Tax=Desertifilum tharense IPPAS B-1220 TaxID=1781255 RepID=A0A1E5QKY6_9CYAN|nr:MULTISPECIES: agenet domain-containing protein [Desertifilum]MDA0210465.1 caspase family protein [Cyanobacteria bacterium FC1]MBD2313898.1 caspase family protein [Desertifilum sp. FACHB-1129]MBD2324729.1 caspase family protein [Desertifilum sp. FACHB-866]MBD2334877.1 caspase family protein [Desertifilum sp. FACHB-868]OEJ75023.1 hypothetical protein BH720_11855 [Desertifilum tharense IPPAS B-1220]